ncbi:ABC transporter permease, partial [Solirubrobacter deserti]
TRKPGLPARGVRALAGLVGGPSAALGGAAGTLARRNAMRNPGRTAVTALALTIGVTLVTAVTVVATGLQNESSGALERRVQADTIITAADGWSPIDPKVEQALTSSTSSIRQDGGLVFGAQEGINGVDPATIERFYRFDFTDGGLTGDGAVVDEGFATEHGLEVGSPLRIQSMGGTTLDLKVSGIEESAILDVLGLGPITISHAAFDRAFEQQRNRLTFAADVPAGALAAFPNVQVQDKDEFIDAQTAWIGMLLAILWVLLALAVIVSLFGIVNTLVLSTFERMRELGTLRALGFSRRQIRRMVRHESVITALIGATLGIAAGLVLAVVVVELLGEYGLSFTVPVGSLLVVAVIAGLAGMLAATMPARRASRIDVLKALAYE